VVFLGLGSNEGNRQENISQALSQLAKTAGIHMACVSSLYETEPFGFKEQSYFLNAVVSITTDLSPEDLLQRCQSIEKNLGRKRHLHWGPRTIDIDILLFDDVVKNTEELILPHPYFAQRRFVLLPLSEIEQGVVFAKKTASQLLSSCKDDGAICLYGPLTYKI
jgi:2-amino-4-hydroxy-6-hydroxymethyldihydropteridine diphosphokinase